MTHITTKEEMLADIRAACIKANPEITNAIPVRRGGKIEDFKDREIRLVDVLLAILAANAANRTNVVLESGGLIKQMEWSDDNRHVYQAGADYNLRADDITRQSDECILFIWTLLK